MDAISIGMIILCLVLWSVIGAIFCIFWIQAKCADGWEVCNPYWAHHYHESVNWFGAIILSLVFTALCPIGAICYWFYKLCTIGRR